MPDPANNPNLDLQLQEAAKQIARERPDLVVVSAVLVDFVLALTKMSEKEQ